MELDFDVELHPDLKPHVVESDLYGEMLHHPLVVMPLIIPSVANEMYTQKLAKLRRGLAPQSAIWLYERPYRLDVAVAWFESGVLTQEDAALMGDVWVDMESSDSIFEPLIQKVVAIFAEFGFLTDGAYQNDQVALHKTAVYT